MFLLVLGGFVWCAVPENGAGITSAKWTRGMLDSCLPLIELGN